MGVLNFRGYILSELHETEGYYDENGDYQDGTEEWVDSYRCGCQPANLENPLLNIPDGAKIEYDYTVTLPANCRTFEHGESVRVNLKDHPERVYSVTGFSRYQHFAKLYIKAVD